MLGFKFQRWRDAQRYLRCSQWSEVTKACFVCWLVPNRWLLFPSTKLRPVSGNLSVLVLHGLICVFRFQSWNQLADSSCHPRLRYSNRTAVSLHDVSDQRCQGRVASSKLQVWLDVQQESVRSLVSALRTVNLRQLQYLAWDLWCTCFIVSYFMLL